MQLFVAHPCLVRDLPGLRRSDSDSICDEGAHAVVNRFHLPFQSGGGDEVGEKVNGALPTLLRTARPLLPCIYIRNGYSRPDSTTATKAIFSPAVGGVLTILSPSCVTTRCGKTLAIYLLCVPYGSKYLSLNIRVLLRGS